jgi:hypothetical protein
VWGWAVGHGHGGDHLKKKNFAFVVPILLKQRPPPHLRRITPGRLNILHIFPEAGAAFLIKSSLPALKFVKPEAQGYLRKRTKGLFGSTNRFKYFCYFVL